MNRCENFIYNFRELGGIKTKDGRTIKDGFFFRGGPLIVGNDEEKEMIDELNLKVIIDFRSYNEGDKHEKLYVPSNVEYHRQSALLNTSGFDDDGLDLSVNSETDIEEMAMFHVYKEIFFDNLAYKLGIKYIEKLITPIYFNCSAGKDRTGAFAAIILLLLDVDEEEIYKEYEKTNDWLKKHFENYDEIPNLSKVDRKWLKAGIDEIKNKYKTIDEYFLKEYGIDSKKREEIKNYYLREEETDEEVHSSN